MGRGKAAHFRTTEFLSIRPSAGCLLQPEGSSIVAVGTMHSSSFSHLTAHSSSLALRCRRLTCHRQAIASTSRQVPSSTVGLLNSTRIQPQRQTAKGSLPLPGKEGLRRHMLVDCLGRALVQQVARSGPELGRPDMLYVGCEDSRRVCWGAEAALAAGRFQRQETFRVCLAVQLTWPYANTPPSAMAVPAAFCALTGFAKKMTAATITTTRFTPVCVSNNTMRRACMSVRAAQHKVLYLQLIAQA